MWGVIPFYQIPPVHALLPSHTVFYTSFPAKGVRIPPVVSCVVDGDIILIIFVPVTPRCCPWCLVDLTKSSNPDIAIKVVDRIQVRQSADEQNTRDVARVLYFDHISRNHTNPLPLTNDMYRITSHLRELCGDYWCTSCSSRMLDWQQNELDHLL